jgi:mannose-6-phosphate isomerase-like protein (cupin superfamily)
MTVSLSVAALLLAGAALAQAPQTPASQQAAPARAPEEGGAGRGNRVLKLGLSARPEPLTPWRAPNRPHWKLSEILATHAKQARWSQTVVKDNHFTATFIQMAAGEKSKRLFYPDNEMFWVVQSGQMRVSIDGMEPFLAGKSTLVQVPARTPFHVETVGDAPVLRWEVIHSGAMPVYAADEKPDPIAGQGFVRIAIPSGTPPKLDPAKIYIDFDKDVVQGGGRAGRFLISGSFIRGMSIPTPPPDDLGHWHVETSEIYFIMEGKLSYQLEGQAPFMVEQGDVVYVPFGRFHRNNFSGTGMATRLAIFPAGQINNLDPENPSKQAP